MGRGAREWSDGGPRGTAGPGKVLDEGAGHDPAASSRQQVGAPGCGQSAAVHTRRHHRTRIIVMHISFATSRSGGFKKWSDEHPPASNDDDYPSGVTPVAIAVPRVDEPEMMLKRPNGA